MTFPEFLVICEPGTGLESSVRISAAHYSLLAVTHTLSQSLKGPAFPPHRYQLILLRLTFLHLQMNSFPAFVHLILFKSQLTHKSVSSIRIKLPQMKGPPSVGSTSALSLPLHSDPSSLPN